MIWWRSKKIDIWTENLNIDYFKHQRRSIEEGCYEKYYGIHCENKEIHVNKNFKNSQKILMILYCNFIVNKIFKSLISLTFN